MDVWSKPEISFIEPAPDLGPGSAADDLQDQQTAWVEKVAAVLDPDAFAEFDQAYADCINANLSDREAREFVASSHLIASARCRAALALAWKIAEMGVFPGSALVGPGVVHFPAGAPIWRANT